MAGADGSGGRNPAGLLFAAGFSAGAGAGAGSVAYSARAAPTLKGSPSGNAMPSVLCPGDQGGQVMDWSENLSGTLRAQTHGHPPLVLGPELSLYENHGVDARYTGPHDVAPTMSARYGTGGNNIPLLSQRFYRRHRADRFTLDTTASTQAARQSKDAVDLACQPTSGNGCPVLLRRLTPLECERLQGFPDGWTDLPNASDSARYKALGNSVAIPCVDFLLRGIALALAAGAV